jgi:hypothetical protein
MKVSNSCQIQVEHSYIYEGGPITSRYYDPEIETASRDEIRSGFKTPSKAQWLRCRPPINAHIPMYAALSRSVCALPLNLI